MSQGYSAKVELYFEGADWILSLAQVSRDKIICKGTTFLRGGEVGEMVAVIDGFEARRKVRVVSTEIDDGRTVAVVEGVE